VTDRVLTPMTERNKLALKQLRERTDLAIRRLRDEAYRIGKTCGARRADLRVLLAELECLRAERDLLRAEVKAWRAFDDATDDEGVALQHAPLYDAATEARAAVDAFDKEQDTHTGGSHAGN